MKARDLSLFFIAAILAIGLTAAGCSGKNKLLNQVSGMWQNNQDHTPVDIQLVGDNKSVTIDGHPYPVSIDKVEMINYLVELKVQNGASEPESWTIRELWDENGDSFKLSFKHSGRSEVLVSKTQS